MVGAVILDRVDVVTAREVLEPVERVVTDDHRDTSVDALLRVIALRGGREEHRILDGDTGLSGAVVVGQVHIGWLARACRTGLLRLERVAGKEKVGVGEAGDDQRVGERRVLDRDVAGAARDVAAHAAEAVDREPGGARPEVHRHCGCSAGSSRDGDRLGDARPGAVVARRPASVWPAVAAAT